MSHNTTIRSFYPGDKWLYYKLYGGVKSCDFILPIYILPMMNRLKRMHLISKWFYIRYSDPDFHIRLRIELTSNIYFADVAEMHIDAYGISFGMGIIFILISLFCKQGAEFKSEK